ncbi:MAG: Inner rane amino-acid transporter permease protein YecS, partial [Planctomycetota bacterium]
MTGGRQGGRCGWRWWWAVAACWLGLIAAAAAAAELDDIRARGELVWGADQEGGGPHVYIDPENPTRLAGFEVDLADMLAAELGVTARFQQGQWDRLPLLLGRAADCVINGIESTPERARDWRCSRPYFAYALQLVARRDSPLDSPEALAKEGPRGPWRVGVLTGSAAEIEMRRRTDFAVEVVGYDGTVDCLEQL